VCRRVRWPSDVARLAAAEVDLDRDVVFTTASGAKDRQVRFGPKTGRALSRYLRIRAQHRYSMSEHLWLAVRDGSPLAATGINLIVRRRSAAARCGAHLHAHRWRHTFAHEWKVAGGDTGDLMLLLGWTSDDIPRPYGASAAAERAHQVHARLKVGERV
jgi:integrase